MAVARFVRGVGAPDAVTLDAAQAEVLALPLDAHASVLGAPGTGKTTALVEFVADRVDRLEGGASAVLVLAPNRRAATVLRDRLALRLGRVTDGPLARSPLSFAFDVVRRIALRTGAAAPALLSGPDQDAIVAELLEGHVDDGRGPEWPPSLDVPVRRLATFRTELRDLVMRATEHEVTPERMVELGAQLDMPAWAPAAAFLREYGDVVANWASDAGDDRERLDPSELAAFAATAIDEGEAAVETGGIRLVVVDDLQEFTASTIALLRALAGQGAAVVAFGDPDVSGNAFRGGEPDALGRLAQELGVPRVRRVVLRTAHRHDPTLRRVVAAVTERVGAAAAGTQRQAVAGRPPGERPLVVVHGTTTAREFAGIARELRRAHLREGVPWARMAVAVRSGSLVPALAKALAIAEVPVRTSLAAAPPREEPAARALLAIADVATGRRALDEPTAVELLLSGFGGLDRLGLRTLRLALRTEELAGDGERPSGDLLVEALAEPGRLVTIDHRVARSASRVAAVIAAARRSADAGGSAEEVLWAAWEASRVAERWRAEALGAGIVAADANRSLDAVLGLFAAARRFVERNPGDSALNFLEAIEEQSLAEDLIAPPGRDDTVLVTSASALVGLEFDVVAVAGLQEGVWPNLRLRGSLLGADRLVRAVRSPGVGTTDERVLVRDDELRMFALAASRASKRLVLGAVANDDEAPSVLFSLLPTDAAVFPDTATPRPLTLRGRVGRLRRVLADDSANPGTRRAAASALARLAAAGVPGADPASWHGVLAPSTDVPVFDLADETVQVPVAPSQLERFEDEPLRWFIDSVAGDTPVPTANMGTVIHWALEHSEPTDEAIWASVEQRWHELQFDANWDAERQRRAARRMCAALAEYLRRFVADGSRLVSAEGSFSFAVDRAVVRGKIDRVEQRSGGRVVIVDLKTGSVNVAEKDLDRHAQLSAYQAAYEQGLLEGLGDEHVPGGAELLFVKKESRGAPYTVKRQEPHDETQREEFLDRVRAAAAGMAATAFRGALEVEQFAPGEERMTWHRIGAVSGD